MTSCVRNIHIKNYQNLITGFQVTIKNVEDVFRDSVDGQIKLMTSTMNSRHNKHT